MKSILTRFATGAAAAAISVVGLTALPAHAASQVDRVNFGPNAVRFDYNLDTDALRNQAGFPGSVNGDGDGPCATTRTASAAIYTTVSFSVGTTGTYTLSDVGTSGTPTPPVSGAGTQSPGNALAAIYAGAAPSPLGTSCLVTMEVGATPVALQAGTTYTLVLGDFVRDHAGETTKKYSVLLNGPGAIFAGALTPESALSLCAPGADVPAGYTLREGTARSETLTGTAGNDVIRGLGGNDVIRGLGGNDVLCGGEGQDTLDGGAGNDFVFGEAGQDTLSGGIGDDYLDGALGSDTVNGGDGADTLLGGDGQDTLNGQAGDDELFAGTGQDVLDGGAGTDVGTDTDPRSIFRNIETVNGPPAPGPQPTSTATR